MEKRSGRSGIYREVEGDLILSLQTAIAMRTWLDQKINELQQINEFIGTLKTTTTKDKK